MNLDEGHEVRAIAYMADRQPPAEDNGADATAELTAVAPPDIASAGGPAGPSAEEDGRGEPAPPFE
jgi:hypothetical protein